MTLSVMITTKNRIGELRRTWRALQQLNPSPLEVLITTDGCTEDTVAAVKAGLPEARLFVNPIGLGSVASRDRMLRAARGDLVLALDDDSYPEELNCIYSGHERDESRTHHRHARNEFWSTLMRCPFPFVLGVLAWRVFSQFRYAYKRGWSWVAREPVWWRQALSGIPYCLRKRKPVSWPGYKRWLALP